MVDADVACSGAQNHWDAPNFLGMHILPCKKENSFDVQITSQIDKRVNTKYYYSEY